MKSFDPEMYTTRRFITSAGAWDGTVALRDRNAPYHCVVVNVVDLPTEKELGEMTERDLDAVLFAARYPHAIKET